MPTYHKMPCQLEQWGWTDLLLRRGDSACSTHAFNQTHMTMWLFIAPTRFYNSYLGYGQFTPCFHVNLEMNTFSSYLVLSQCL
jgi:hypothetical protein